MALIGKQFDLDALAVCMTYDQILEKFKVAKEAASGAKKSDGDAPAGNGKRRERTVADEEDAEIVDDKNDAPF